MTLETYDCLAEARRIILKRKLGEVVSKIATYSSDDPMPLAELLRQRADLWAELGCNERGVPILR